MPPPTQGINGETLQPFHPQAPVWLSGVPVTAVTAKRSSWKLTPCCGMGNPLAVQGLGLRAFTAKARFQSLVRKLGSHKPHGTSPPHPAAKREREREKEWNQITCCVYLSCLFGLIESGLGPQPYFVFLGCGTSWPRPLISWMFLALVLSVASL